MLKSSVFKVVLTVMLLSLAGATAEAAPPKPKALSWDRLTRTIEATSPLMQAARAGLRTFEAKLKQAQWAYFPSFTFNTVLGPTPKITGNALRSVTDTSRWGYYVRAEVTVVQPVYTFGKISALKRAAKHGVAIGKALVSTARWELRLRTSQAYYGVLLSQELDRILKAGKRWLKRAEARMDALRARDDDDYNQNEHLRLKTRVSEFYALEAENKRLHVSSTQGLRLLLSAPVSHKVKLAEKHLTPIKVNIQPAETYWALAKRAAPGLLIARAKHAANAALHAKRRADLFPDLVLIGSAGIGHSDVVTSQPSVFAVNPFHPLATATIALRWSLDVVQRVFKMREASATAAVSAHQAALLAQQTELRVRQLVQRLISSSKLMAVYRRSRKAAQGWLMASWDLYEDGFGDFRSVMESLVQFYQKRFAYLQTVFQHNTLVFELSAAVGHDIRKLRKPSRK